MSENCARCNIECSSLRLCIDCGKALCTNCIIPGTNTICKISVDKICSIERKMRIFNVVLEKELSELEKDYFKFRQCIVIATPTGYCEIVKGERKKEIVCKRLEKLKDF